jgi:catechol 2,3-dioxygenase-like lactoylglutathione lyase family enzyme
MDGQARTTPTYDRTVEDLGNIVELGHVNVTVPDQRLATIFYVSGLGLTRDPYLMTGLENMWINVGRAQFHLPSRPPQVVRGTTGLVISDPEALLARLARVRQDLAETKFGFRETDDGVETTCPWGNRIRCHAPDAARFGRLILGMPYVECDIPQGTSLPAIARFYREILGGIAGTAKDARGAYAWAVLGDGNRILFRETAGPLPAYDGHHIQITLADFSGPHGKLLARGLVTEESDQHQYRFKDIVDVETNRVLFTIEHEVRSMRHPLFARQLVNRNPAQTNRAYAPEWDALRWAMPAS